MQTAKPSPEVLAAQAVARFEADRAAQAAPWRDQTEEELRSSLDEAQTEEEAALARIQKLPVSDARRKAQREVTEATGRSVAIDQEIRRREHTAHMALAKSAVIEKLLPGEVRKTKAAMLDQIRKAPHPSLADREQLRSRVNEQPDERWLDERRRAIEARLDEKARGRMAEALVSGKIR